jgi:hypothetical protein
MQCGMRHIVICDLPPYALFFFLHYLVNGTILGGEGGGRADIIEYKMFV